MEDGHRRLTVKSYERLRDRIIFRVPEGFRCLDREATTSHILIANPSFRDQSRDLLSSNIIRAPPALPQVFSHTQFPPLTVSNNPSFSLAQTEWTPLNTNAVRWQRSSRVERSSYRNIAPVQNPWNPSVIQNPAVASHTRQYGSRTTVLPTVERLVADKNDDCGDTGTFGSYLRTVAVVVILGSLLYVAKKRKLWS